MKSQSRVLRLLFAGLFLTHSGLTMAESNEKVSGSKVGWHFETDEKPEKSKKNKNEEITDDDLADLGIIDLGKSGKDKKTSATAADTKSAATMKAVETAFPELSCQLIDNRPYMNLLAAARKLQTAVNPPEQCKDNADLATVTNNVKSIIEAAKALQGSVTSTDGAGDLKVATDQISEFQKNLVTMATGLDSVTKQLGQNSFIESKCGSKLMTGSGIISAVSDLITNFAPYALIGASFNPTLKVAMPYMLGISGVGSFAKIIKGLAEQQNLQVEKPEVRDAILKNICEYNKISQKFRFLRLAQSGQIAEINNEIQQIAGRNNKILTQRFSPNVISLFKAQLEINKQINSFKSQTKEDFEQTSSLLNAAKSDDSSSLVCSIGVELAKSAKNTENFPGRIIKNYRSILQKNQTTSALSNGLINSTEILQKNLMQLTEKEMISDDGCSKFGLAYIKNLNKLAIETSKEISQAKLIVENEFNSNQEFARFKIVQQASQNQIENLVKISKILESLNRENAVIDKSELDTHLFELKSALFGQPSGVLRYYGKSPAMAWLDFTDEQFNRSFTSYKSELEELKRDVYSITKSARGDIFQHDSKGNIVRDQMGRALRTSWSEQNEQIINDLKSAESLSLLTLPLAESNPENKKSICLRLENIWLSWSAAKDHLAAENFFCSQIRQHFDRQVTQSSLIERCNNQMQLDGNVYKASGINTRYLELTQEKYKTSASLVGKKILELKCDLPKTEDITK